MTNQLPQTVAATFLLGASDATRLPSTKYPEIAVFGRSNVGKSTFINRLANHKHLARASKTPGRTKEINLFELNVKVTKDAATKYILADLPGYGFAKVAKSELRALATLIETYIETRAHCACGCILIDIRREPKDEEQFVATELFKRDVPTLIILTKADKLSKNEQKKQIASISKMLHLEPSDILITGEGMHPAPIWQRILSTTVGS